MVIDDNNDGVFTIYTGEGNIDVVVCIMRQTKKWTVRFSYNTAVKRHDI